MGLRDTWQEVHLLARLRWSLVDDQLLPTPPREAPAAGNRAWWGRQHFCSGGKSMRGAYDDWTNIYHKCGCSDRNHNQDKREKRKLKKDATDHRGITVIRDQRQAQ